MENTSKDSISLNQNKLEVSVDIIIFQENNTTIVYCPSLEVYGYGTDENEAHDSFKISLAEFLRYGINENTLTPELKRLGWKLEKSKTRTMIPPTITELLAFNKNLSRIYNKFDFRKTATSVSIPAVA